MATPVKHNGEPMARKLSAITEKDGTNLLTSGNQGFSDVFTEYHQRITRAGGSPKSVIRDDTPSTNSSYYYSCSSTSSSAERTPFANSQQCGPSHPHRVNHQNTYRRKLKWQPLAPKGFTTLVESNAGTDATNGASTEHDNADPIDKDINGPQFSTHGIHSDLDPQNKVAAEPPLIATTTQVCKPSKCHESHVSKGLSLTSDLEDVNNSKLSRCQAAPIKSLINTLMQQYKPSLLVEDGTLRHASLKEILADVRNGGFIGDSIKPKLLASKWDDDGKWMHTKLTSTSAQTINTSRVPLFKLSHNKHALPVLSETQPCQLQTDTGMWNKDNLNNEVEKLTNTVSCAQVCLEQIQPIPPPKNTTTIATNPFLAQGVFQNRVYPTVVQGTLKPNSQADPVIARSVLGNSHAPYTGTSTVELFWSSPIKAPDTQHTSSNTNLLTASQSPQKEILRPPAVHFRLTKSATIKDTACRGDLTHIGEHFHVQKHEKSSASTTMSCMKDASTEVTPSTSHRDIGTQMTPMGSLRHPTPPHSPQRCRAMSPTRQNTPMRVPAPPSTGIIDMSRMNPLEMERWRRSRFEFQGQSDNNQVQGSLCKSFDSTWSSREEEEEDIAKSLRHLDLEDLKRDVLEARASAWKEATRSKLLAKYDEEETKIRAWEDLQAAKAAADLKKLEMKLEKKRIQMRTRIASKLHAAHKRAQERRATVKAHKFDAIQKTCHRAEEMRDEATLFQASYPVCACFSGAFD